MNAPGGEENSCCIQKIAPGRLQRRVEGRYFLQKKQHPGAKLPRGRGQVFDRKQQYRRTVMETIHVKPPNVDDNETTTTDNNSTDEDAGMNAAGAHERPGDPRCVLEGT